MTEVLKPLLDIVYTGRYFVVNCLRRPLGRKTDIFEVITKEDSTVLAEIRWHSPWRKYAIYPRSSTVWEATCLTGLAKCLEQLNTQDQKGYPRVAKRFFTAVVVAVTLISGGLTSPSWAAHEEQPACATTTQQVTGVATAARHVASVDFIATKGQFHTTPLISATVEVTEPGSCLLVQFRPRAHPDLFPLVYQVRINGVPMEGQRPRNLYVFRAPPAFEHPADTVAYVHPLITYTFVQRVGTPGTHVVEVRYAVACLNHRLGCQRAIDSAALIVGYQ